MEDPCCRDLDLKTIFNNKGISIKKSLSGLLFRRRLLRVDERSQDSYICRNDLKKNKGKSNKMLL